MLTTKNLFLVAASTCSPELLANYSYLRPGNYTFKVIAANSDGVWNDVGAELQIVVLPVFYQTWWFLILIALVIVGLSISVFRWRVWPLQRRNALQETFSPLFPYSPTPLLQETQMPKETTVIIADDHPIFRHGLRQVIEMSPALRIIGEAEDGEAALACIESTLPAVAVLDVDMPKQDGFAVARVVIEKRLPVAIVFLTMHKDESLLNAALDLGVKGYVLKDSALADIVSSIKAVVGGENFISPALTTFLINRSRRSASSSSEQGPSVRDLSPTERRILNLIGDYKTSKEIAEQLFISIRTVEHHRGNIAIKLRLRGAHALIKFVLENKAELT